MIFKILCGIFILFHFSYEPSDICNINCIERKIHLIAKLILKFIKDDCKILCKKCLMDFFQNMLTITKTNWFYNKVKLVAECLLNEYTCAQFLSSDIKKNLNTFLLKKILHKLLILFIFISIYLFVFTISQFQ